MNCNNFGKGLFVFSLTLLAGIFAVAFFISNESNELPIDYSKTEKVKEFPVFNPPKPAKCKSEKDSDEQRRVEFYAERLKLYDLIAEKQIELRNEKKASKGNKDSSANVAKLLAELKKLEEDEKQLEEMIRKYWFFKELEKMKFSDLDNMMKTEPHFETDLLYRGECYDEFR